MFVSEAFDTAWMILKRQATLGEFHPDFPSPYGKVKYYHGTKESNLDSIKRRGLLPNDGGIYGYGAFVTNSPSDAQSYANFGQPTIIGVREGAGKPLPSNLIEDDAYFIEGVPPEYLVTDGISLYKGLLKAPVYEDAEKLPTEQARHYEMLPHLEQMGGFMWQSDDGMARGTMRPDYWKNSLLINNFEMAGPKRGQGNAREYLQNMINEGHNHFKNELQGTHVTNVEPHTARFWNKIVDEGMLDGAHERADIRTDLSGSRHGVYAYDPHTFEPWMHELGEDYAEYYDLPTDQWYQDAME